MFGIGLPELLLILIVALVVLGPKRLPELARSLGRALAEFRKTAEDIKENLNMEEDWQDMKKEIQETIELPTPPNSIKTPTGSLRKREKEPEVPDFEKTSEASEEEEERR